MLRFIKIYDSTNQTLSKYHKANSYNWFDEIQRKCPTRKATWKVSYMYVLESIGSKKNKNICIYDYKILK